MYRIITGLVEDCIFSNLHNNSEGIAVKAGNVRLTVRNMGQRGVFLSVKTGASVGSATRLVETKTMMFLR
jgi:hypothetical protein